MSTQRDQTKNQYRCWKSESGAGFSARSRDRYILPYRRTRRGPIPEPIRTLPPNDARRKNKRTLTVHPHFSEGKWNVSRTMDSPDAAIREFVTLSSAFHGSD
ncbi:hypothetical protein CEXT_781851 [Caerostris extrusa]|uniref:Uncharacterized protein n=1 Tax=Caerostris extrusa TaxID=172846 RepID=A0AAV4VDP1_CAEEX|nr:hypothetical protein CEXT_781851 [Caerostris extrusa]